MAGYLLAYFNFSSVRLSCTTSCRHQRVFLAPSCLPCPCAGIFPSLSPPLQVVLLLCSHCHGNFKKTWPFYIPGEGEVCGSVCVHVYVSGDGTGHPYPFSFHFQVQSIPLQPLERDTLSCRCSKKLWDRSCVPCPADHLKAGGALLLPEPSSRLCSNGEKKTNKNKQIKQKK